MSNVYILIINEVIKQHSAAICSVNKSSCNLQFFLYFVSPITTILLNVCLAFLHCPWPMMYVIYTIMHNFLEGGFGVLPYFAGTPIFCGYSHFLGTPIFCGPMGSTNNKKYRPNEIFAHLTQKTNYSLRNTGSIRSYILPINQDAFFFNRKWLISPHHTTFSTLALKQSCISCCCQHKMVYWFTTEMNFRKPWFCL